MVTHVVGYANSDVIPVIHVVTFPANFIIIWRVGL